MICLRFCYLPKFYGWRHTEGSWAWCHCRDRERHWNTDHWSDHVSRHCEFDLEERVVDRRTRVAPWEWGCVAFDCLCVDETCNDIHGISVEGHIWNNHVGLTQFHLDLSTPIVKRDSRTSFVSYRMMRHRGWSWEWIGWFERHPFGYASDRTEILCSIFDREEEEEPVCRGNMDRTVKYLLPFLFAWSMNTGDEHRGSSTIDTVNNRRCHKEDLGQRRSSVSRRRSRLAFEHRDWTTRSTRWIQLDERQSTRNNWPEVVPSMLDSIFVVLFRQSLPAMTTQQRFSARPSPLVAVRILADSIESIVTPTSVHIAN